MGTAFRVGILVQGKVILFCYQADLSLIMDFMNATCMEAVKK